MWIALPAENHLPEMPGIMGEPIDVGKLRFKPWREEVNRKREAIHLGKKGDHKTAKGAK